MISWRNPGDAARPLRLRHLRGRDPRGPRRGRQAHALEDRPHQRRLLRRHPQRGRARRRQAPAGVASLTLLVCALDNEQAGHRLRARRQGARDARGRRVRPPRLRRRPGAGAACSRGCARTTWSGTTSSTTTCWARRRPRSTSCSGTRTPSAWPPACTATSCRLALEQLAHPPRRASRRSASRSTCRRVDRRQLRRRRRQRPHRAVGERRAAASSCSAATPASCWRRAATSRRS